ncbi:MAG: LysR family transcriptional regulator [Pseudomonadota bacterium]
MPPPPRPRLSIRVDFPNGRRFGPGKADLLAAIETAGTVSGAAQSLAMSYPRALRLIEDMNGLFDRPLVETFHGGQARGGAQLTDAGKTVLAHYRALEAELDAKGAALLAAFGPETAPR